MFLPSSFMSPQRGGGGEDLIFFSISALSFSACVSLSLDNEAAQKVNKQHR